MIHGLKSKPEFNGKRGRVDRFEPTTRRYTVTFDDDETKSKNLKPGNLKAIEVLDSLALLSTATPLAKFMSIMHTNFDRSQSCV